MTRFGSADQRQFANWALGLGWSCQRTGSGHLCWRHPRVMQAVFTPATPRSGWRKARQKLNTALSRATATTPATGDTERRAA